VPYKVRYSPDVLLRLREELDAEDEIQVRSYIADAAVDGATLNRSSCPAAPPASFPDGRLIEFEIDRYDGEGRVFVSANYQFSADEEAIYVRRIGIIEWD
jgi:hypothetical protein